MCFGLPLGRLTAVRQQFTQRRECSLCNPSLEACSLLEKEILMHLSRFHRLVLVSMLCLAVLLATAPSAFASSLNRTQRLACPSISGFTPSSGPPGTSVTISGCGFTGATKVTFHGVSASFTVN